jgi:formamidopyrimidine-DNA glycosylase
MPELPEVEHLRLSLVPVLAGLKVCSAQVFRSDIFDRVDEAGRVVRSRRSRKPLASASASITQAELLVGQQITRLDRTGKQLFVFGCDALPALGVHLGMTGQLYFVPAGAASPVKAFASGIDHVHVRWTLARSDSTPAGELVFRDPRRFGALTLFPHERAAKAWASASLGPDALCVSGDQLFARLRTSSRMIKAALLDQTIIAGVGNIYADEALFRSKIRPQRRCNKLSTTEAGELAMQLRAILAQAVTVGGSTLRNYVDGLGNSGAAQDSHQVYGRRGERCFVCGQTLRQGVVAQRTTVWCTTCQ